MAHSAYETHYIGHRAALADILWLWPHLIRFKYIFKYIPVPVTSSAVLPRFSNQSAAAIKRPTRDRLHHVITTDQISTPIGWSVGKPYAI